MAGSDRFWEVVCEYQPLLRAMVALLAVMTLLLAFSFLVLEPGSGPYAIAVFDALLLVLAFALVGGLSVACKRREEYR